MSHAQESKEWWEMSLSISPFYGATFRLQVECSICLDTVLGGQQVIFTVAVLGSSSYSMKRVKVLQGTFTWGRDLRHNTTAKFKIWKDVERSQSVLACLSRRLFWGTLSVCWFIRRLQIELNKHLHEKNHAWTTDYSNHSIAENELTSWNHVTGAPSKRIVYCLIWTHGSLQI